MINPFFSLNIFSQSNEKLTGDIKESGIYHKDIVLKWRPENKEHDLHTLGIREARFSFSDMKFTYTNNDTLTNAGITFSGPNLTIKDFIIQSNIRSKNWITTEKINRLNRRERTPKEAISIIANAIDLASCPYLLNFSFHFMFWGVTVYLIMTNLKHFAGVKSTQ